MIRRCMAGSRCFGIVNVYMSPNGSWVPYSVGCMVSISKTTILPSRRIIHCKGLRRFRIQQKWDQDGYLVGRVECFGDEPIQEEERESYTKDVMQARQMLHHIVCNEGRSESLQKLLGQAGDIPIDDLEFSYWLSSLLPISPEHKQELLGTTSTAWRFARLLYIIGRVTFVLQNGGAGAAFNALDHGGLSEDTNGHASNERSAGADDNRTNGGDGADGTDGRDDMAMEPAEGRHSGANGGRAPRGLAEMGVMVGALVGDGMAPQHRGGQNERLGSGSCFAS